MSRVRRHNRWEPRDPIPERASGEHMAGWCRDQANHLRKQAEYWDKQAIRYERIPGYQSNSPYWWKKAEEAGLA